MKRVFQILTIAAPLALIACQDKTPAPLQIDNPQGLLLVQSCSACHYASNETLPDISGLSKSDMLTALKTYQSDPNGQTVMHRLMRGYDDAALAQIAATLGTDDD